MGRFSKQNKRRKRVHILLSVVFGLFAIVQLNDPDGFLWFGLYILVALLAIVSNYYKVPRILIALLSIGYFIYAAMHFSYFIDWIQIEHKEELFGEMVYQKPYLEGTREFLGLVLAAIALLYQLKERTKI